MYLTSAVLFVGMAVISPIQEPYSTEWNQKSTIKNEKVIEFPGFVLEPGTYVIRQKESTETRALLEICSQDESQILGTVEAVPDHEQRPDDDSEFVYFNVPQGKPAPVRAWFFTGEMVGWEFVYPKARAKEIAQAADTHVMASKSIDKDDVIVAVTPNGTEVVIDDPRLTQTARRKPEK
jgi:hypothetical protein